MYEVYHYSIINIIDLGHRRGQWNEPFGNGWSKFIILTKCHPIWILFKIIFRRDNRYLASQLFLCFGDILTGLDWFQSYDICEKVENNWVQRVYFLIHYVGSVWIVAQHTVKTTQRCIVNGSSASAAHCSKSICIHISAHKNWLSELCDKDNYSYHKRIKNKCQST